MNILHVTPYYWPAVRYGGPIFSVAGLCRALAARGHAVQVYTTAVDGRGNSPVRLEEITEVDGVQVRYFPSNILRRLFWSPRMQHALQRNIEQFDIVHLHTVFVWPVYAAAMAAQRAGVPYLLAPRGMLEQELIRRKSRLVKSLWIRLYGKKILAGAAALQVTSQREADKIRELHLDIPRLVTVPNGIDLAALPDFSDVQNAGACETQQWGKKGYVLFLGRINWKKGLDRLIAAWSYGVDLPLILAGNDEEKYTAELQDLAAAQGVQEKIHFIGPVTGPEKWQLYSNAELLVLPSYSENFGNVVLEAMAAGCPVLVTPEVGLADAVIRYDAGLVVEGKPEKLAAAVQQLLADKAALQQMCRQGRLAAQEHFSWPAIGKRMEKVYLELLDNGRRRPNNTAGSAGSVR
ncbi:MAG: glycosyltransferase [Candidatus Electrothrix sp. YB6]